MKFIKNDALTIEQVDAANWRVSCEIKLDGGQRIGISLVLPAQPDQSVGQIERAVIRQAAKELQELLGN